MRPLALLIPLTLSAAALAQDAPPPRPMLSDACRAEVEQLCPAGTDRAARRQCLMTNRDKLSDGCKAEIAKRMEAMRAMREGMQASNQPTPPTEDNGTAPPR